MEPQWLIWARELAGIAQNGLAFTASPYDRERYLQLQKLAMEMVEKHTEVDQTTISSIFDQQAGYATPKVDVRGVVFQGEKLLMVREKADGGRWTLPGGWADVNQTPSDAVIKEIHEETGYRARATKILAVYDRTRQGHPPHAFHVYKLFIRCELLSDTPDLATTDYETGEATFFSESDLPTDLSLGRVLSAQLHRFFEHLHNPDLPTDFD